jgi:hypothetical protein
METSNMVGIFNGIIQEYVREVNEASVQGKFFDD